MKSKNFLDASIEIFKRWVVTYFLAVNDGCVWK